MILQCLWWRMGDEALKNKTSSKRKMSKEALFKEEEKKKRTFWYAYHLWRTTTDHYMQKEVSWILNKLELVMLHIQDASTRPCSISKHGTGWNKHTNDHHFLCLNNWQMCVFCLQLYFIMDQWTKIAHILQMLPPDSVQSLYPPNTFPIEARYYAAEWIDNQRW